MSLIMRRLLLLCALVGFVSQGSLSAIALDVKQAIRSSQSKVVKIYGAGGLRQMEAYQSGVLISPDGHVLTVMSYVLDTDDVAVVLDDGSKWQAEFVGSDPVRELAILKIPVEDQTLPYFDLEHSPRANLGDRVLALSNLFGIATGDESASVLQGVVTAIAPLQARRGSYEIKNRDPVYVVDAYTNNPGAAGGALVNWRGEFLGLLGKELRSQVTGTWLNFSLPAKLCADSVEGILSGKSMQLEDDMQRAEMPYSTRILGIRTIPNVLPLTPPYVDSIRRDSPAERAGLRADDLIVFVADSQVNSCRALEQELLLRDQREPLEVTVLRDGALFPFTLRLEESPPAAEERALPPTDVSLPEAEES